MKQMNQGVALVVETEKEAVTVHLGPSWYLKKRLDTKVVKGDQMEIEGVCTTFGGKPVIIAAGVKKGDKVLCPERQRRCPRLVRLGLEKVILFRKGSV